MEFRSFCLERALFIKRILRTILLGAFQVPLLLCCIEIRINFLSRHSGRGGKLLVLILRLDVLDVLPRICDAAHMRECQFL